MHFGCVVTAIFFLKETFKLNALILWLHVEVQLRFSLHRQAFPFTSIIKIDEETFREALSIFKESRGYSFTDCTSFAVMKKYGITHAFTFDKHFREAGFQAIP